MASFNPENQSETEESVNRGVNGRVNLDVDGNVNRGVDVGTHRVGSYRIGFNGGSESTLTKHKPKITHTLRSLCWVFVLRKRRPNPGSPLPVLSPFYITIQLPIPIHAIPPSSPSPLHSPPLHIPSNAAVFFRRLRTRSRHFARKSTPPPRRRG
jgi:hypothetical protein